jgi:hypothetical protein
MLAPKDAPAAISITDENGTPHLFKPGPDRTIEVPEEHVAELAAFGWQRAPAARMTDDELAAATARRAFLQRRREELTELVTTSTAQAREVTRRLGTARVDLVEGRLSSEGLQDIAREEGSTRARAEEDIVALRAAESALSAVSESIIVEELNRAAAAADAASEPLRVDIRTCVDLFLDGIDDLLSPLRKAHEIRLELERSFPSARQVPLFTIESLAREFEARYSGPRFEEQIRSGSLREQVVAFLVALIRGPAPVESQSAFTKEVAALGIKVE